MINIDSNAMTDCIDSPTVNEIKSHEFNKFDEIDDIKIPNC